MHEKYPCQATLILSNCAPVDTQPPPHKLIAQLITEELKERSRRFSQLPPASEDSPDAVKMGSKFTMIPTDANR